MIDDDAIQIVLLAAKRIMESESQHNFGEYAIDDSEHIPRMERMADAVREVLSESGLVSERCDAIHDDFIDHARQLYVTEWMRPLPGDESPPSEDDGVRAFNRYLKREGL